MRMGSASALPRVHLSNQLTSHSYLFFFFFPLTYLPIKLFYRPRTATPSSSMLKAASETLGPICLSYVAQGVFIISSQEAYLGPR